MNIYTTSDIHGDYDTNLKKIASISNTDYQNDALLVCGDLSHNLSLSYRILKDLKAKFGKVFFVPGNHDFWLHQNDFEDSLKKFEHLQKAVGELGIETGPYRLGNVVLVPIQSWYDYSFAYPGAYSRKIWSDLARCVWPVNMEELTTHFLDMNTSIPISDEDTVITYSHFVPRMDILPQRLVDRIPHIIPFLGSNRIDEQIRQFRSQIHVFGHLHFNIEVEKEGVLYINNALGYPREGRWFREILYRVL